MVECERQLDPVRPVQLGTTVDMVGRRISSAEDGRDDRVDDKR